MAAACLGVVTGADRGIEKEIAFGLVGDGARVIGTARDLDRDDGATILAP